MSKSKNGISKAFGKITKPLANTFKKVTKPVGAFVSKATNPITHSKDLQDTKSEFEDLRACIVTLLDTVQEHTAYLYEERKNCVKQLQGFQAAVSKIQNCPVAVTKSCERALESASKIADAWEAEDQGIANGPESLKDNSKMAGIIGTSGALAGSLTAAFGPSTLMALATTFGTAGTGTAISALSGAAATNAALAAIGGGTVAAGGAGIAGGTFILGLMGPIGLGIAGVTILGTTVFSRSSNDKQIKQLNSTILQMRTAVFKLRNADKFLDELLEKTGAVRNSLDYSVLSKKGNKDYFDANFPKEELFDLASKAKLLGKMTSEDVILEL